MSWLIFGQIIGHLSNLGSMSLWLMQLSGYNLLISLLTASLAGIHISTIDKILLNCAGLLNEVLIL